MSTERQHAMEPAWCVAFTFAGMECYTQTFHEKNKAHEAAAGLNLEDGVTNICVVDL